MKNNSPFKHATIKNKILAYVMIIIVFLSALSIYSLMITYAYKSRIDSMFERNLQLKEISEQFDKTDQQLVVYLSTKSSSSLNDFMLYQEQLQQLAVKATESVEYYTEDELMVLDIKNMIDHYVLESNVAVEKKRSNDVVAYTARRKNAKQIEEYVDVLINELNIRQLDANAETYVYMTEQISRLTGLNVLLIINIILLSVLIVLQMTNNMINPIIRLSHSALDISKGNFDTEEIVVETNDEIEILADAFNKMKLSIHAYIEEMKEKAETEARLKDQEMENLRIQSLLDNAKLYALQSQMNPHFLFNTINAGVQLSMIEGADRTSEFLESMSRLFRYNVKRLDHPVTIKDEIDNIKDYYELLKVRFGDLITFEFIVDSECDKYLMPPLTLQPIVENAYIHGLSKIEEGGNIVVQVEAHDDETIISVSDNGVGISREQIEGIKSGKASEAKDGSPSTGIGMRNIIERLNLFYNASDMLSIAGEVGLGTTVEIKIPNVLTHEDFHL